MSRHHCNTLAERSAACAARQQRIMIMSAGTVSQLLSSCLNQ